VLTVVVIVVATVVIVWMQRRPLLIWVGNLVVEQSELAPADIVAIIPGQPALSGSEAAAIVNAGHASRVLLFSYPPDADEELTVRLGLPPPWPVSTLVLQRLGVRAEAIEVTPIVGSRGTTAVLRALEHYARAHQLRRLIVVTNRSHTRRTAALLRRRLPGISVMVRAPAADSFHPHQWWRHRDSARELLTEALRWFDSFVIGAGRFED
jgi:uncharacterized SAM-binding protein YcdF (DUF218 family)